MFAPCAIAVFGAEEEDSVGGRILRNIVAGGFAGPLHAVRRRGGPIAGVGSCGSLEEIEGDLDLAIAATPAAELPDVLRSCGERGVAGVVIPVDTSPGVSRAGSGAALEVEVLEAAARHGVRIIGPNSVGFARPAAKVNATFSSGNADPGSLALVSQSGAICTAILDWAGEHRIGFSALASLGDAVDVDLGEVLEYLAFDGETRSILLYVERVRSARSFLTGLRVAARLKPVIVVKAGRHVTRPEDRSPACADDAFDAALARAGAVRVASIEQMFAAAQLLGMGRAVAGNRLAVLTNARGPAMLAVDRAADLGLAVPPLADATRANLGELLAPVASLANPVDLLGDAAPDRYRAAVEIVQADPNVDGVLAILAPQALAHPLESAEAVVEANRGSPKPLLACWMGGRLVAGARARLVEAGVPQFATPESAVEAFGHLASYRRNQRLLRRVPGPLAPDSVPLTDLARDLVRNAIAKGRDRLTTTEVRKLLAAFGIRFDATPGSRVRGTELYVSVARDATFGPIIRFGLGGSATGLPRERIVALPPLDAAIIRTLVQSSPIAGVLTSADAFSAEEMAATERVLWALSELACELPEVRGVEIHPLLPNRTEVIAVGASVAVAPPPSGAGPYDHMAIHPYPSQVRDRWQLDDGSTIKVRPIRPEDAELMAAFVRNLSDGSRYSRFMVPLKELTREQLVRFTQVDYDRELALVAFVEREGQEREIAVASYMMAGDGRSAETAIAVADEWQGRGIGVRLLAALVNAARVRGIQRLEGEVLAENSRSRAMLARVGFTIRRDPESAVMCLFDMDLGR